MEYLVIKRDRGRKFSITITKSKYDLIIDAIEGILMAIRAERRLDRVVQNYLEFEKHLLVHGVDQTCYTDWFSGSSDQCVEDCERHVSNLLSSCKTMIDHCIKDLKKYFGDDSIQFTGWNDLRKKPTANLFPIG